MAYRRPRRPKIWNTALRAMKKPMASDANITRSWSAGIDLAMTEPILWIRKVQNRKTTRNTTPEMINRFTSLMAARPPRASNYDFPQQSISTRQAGSS